MMHHTTSDHTIDFASSAALYIFNLAAHILWTAFSYEMLKFILTFVFIILRNNGQQ